MLEMAKVILKARLIRALERELEEQTEEFAL